MNNSFQNAINSGGIYHVKVISPAGEGSSNSHYDSVVNAYDEVVALDDGSMLIPYGDIQRIEIHACQFPYKENTPFLYIYLK